MVFKNHPPQTYEEVESQTGSSDIYKRVGYFQARVAEEKVVLVLEQLAEKTTEVVLI